MAVTNAKLLCLCLVAVAATVAAHEVQTLPGKGGRYSGVQTLPGNIGGGRPGYGGGGGIPPRTPQVQPKPGHYGGKPGNNLKPIGRPPTGHLTRPFDPPKGGSHTKPRPRPSKGGERFRRHNDYDSDESDEGRYRRQVDEEPEDDEEYDDYADEE